VSLHFSGTPLNAAETGGKTFGGTKRRESRFRRAMSNPVGFVLRAINAVRWKVRTVMLNLLCDSLSRWGSKLGVSGNFRARMFWKAGRQDIVPVQDLYDYMSQERAQGQYYSSAPIWSSRSQTIINVLSPLISKECRIVEIGCNSGRNLNHLWTAGYKNVRGIEISEHAVQRLRMNYPCLADVPVDVGPAETAIQQYASSSVDVIFTMATLEHVHPASRFLFKEIARVASRYVLAIESRQGKRSHMQYPWNIKNEFIAVGLTWIDTKAWSALWPGKLTQENEWTEDLSEYDAFLFRVGEAGFEGPSKRGDVKAMLSRIIDPGNLRENSILTYDSPKRSRK
jgi:SAM-dependent methyltransferase